MTEMWGPGTRGLSDLNLYCRASPGVATRHANVRALRTWYFAGSPLGSGAMFTGWLIERFFQPLAFLFRDLGEFGQKSAFGLGQDPRGGF